MAAGCSVGGLAEGGRIGAAIGRETGAQRERPSVDGPGKRVEARIERDGGELGIGGVRFGDLHGARDPRHSRVRAESGNHQVPIDEYEGAARAIAHGGFGDRRDDRNEPVGGAEEPADIEPAVARVEEP